MPEYLQFEGNLYDCEFKEFINSYTPAGRLEFVELLAFVELSTFVELFVFVWLSYCSFDDPTRGAS